MMMQFVQSMCSGFCFGASAKTGLSHGVLAASTQGDITVKDVFGSIIESILPTFLNMFTFVFELLASVLMLIVRFVFNLIDFIYVIVQQLAGQNYNSLYNENLFQDDFVIRTLTSQEVLTVFKRMIIFAVVLIVVFAIIAVIKTEVEAATNNADNSKKRVLVNAMRSCFFILFVPVIALGGIIASNAVLASISRAIGVNNGISISSQIYAASAVEANRYRMYAMGGERMPIIYDFDWENNKHKALETQQMFVTGDFVTEAEYQQDKEGYHAFYDKNLRTIQEEYFVMADLIDFMVTNQQEFYIVNVNHEDLKAYFETTEDGTTALFDIQYTTMSDPVHYKSTLSATDERDGAKFIMCTKEEKEVVNENGQTVVVSVYVPLTNGSMGFKTSYLQTGEIILARGAFTSEGYPTAIKESGNSIHFYREEFLVPTIFDFLPKISYVPLDGMEEMFDTSWLNAVSQTVLGVDIHQFIPYFYYNFEFSAMFTVAEDVVAVVNNSELILNYNWSAGLSSTNFYYNLNFNFLILFFAITLILYTLLTMMWGLIGRVFEMMLLMISYPVAAATVTLDGGSRHQNWTKAFVGKLFMCYGIVIMMQLTLVLSKVIFGLEIFTVQDFENSFLLTMPLFKGFTPQNAAVLMNRLAQVLLLLVLFSMMAVSNLNKKDKNTGTVKSGTGVKLINDLINTGEDVLVSGVSVQKATSSVMHKTADMINGKFLMDQSSKAVESVFGKKNKETGQREGGFVEFIPGVALSRTMREGNNSRRKASKIDGDITELMSAASGGSREDIETIVERMASSRASRGTADTDTAERGSATNNHAESGNTSNDAQNPNTPNEEHGNLTGDRAENNAGDHAETTSAERSSSAEPSSNET